VPLVLLGVEDLTVRNHRLAVEASADENFLKFQILYKSKAKSRDRERAQKGRSLNLVHHARSKIRSTDAEGAGGDFPGRKGLKQVQNFD